MDPIETQKRIIESHKKRILKKNKDFNVDNELLNLSFEYSEIDEELDDVEFTESKSTASCKIDEI